VGDFSKFFVLLGRKLKLSTKKRKQACLQLVFIDNWDVNAHVMTRNQYGVFEITVKPNAKGQVAIPHGSKIKVIR
jgi:hypothetical protein